MANRLLVTGGASGIGKAIAKSGLDAGWDVVVIDRVHAPYGQSLIANLADTQETADALTQALSAGQITRLVNNVGAVFPGPLEELTLEQVDSSLALNVRTAIQVTQALLPGMKSARFGRVVNMTSRASLGKELRSVYSAAKAGLIGLTRVWALELAQHGITVNAIGPGPIATDLFLKANPADSELTRAIIQGVPVGRLGQPEDIAHAAAFFMDDKAGFTTGQTLYVCGGLTVGSNPF